MLFIKMMNSHFFWLENGKLRFKGSQFGLLTRLAEPFISQGRRDSDWREKN